MAQGFNDNVKSLMAFNASDTLHKKIIHDTSVFIIYIYYTLSIGDEPELLYRLEYTKKQYKISAMVRLEEFLVCMIKCDLTKMTLNIYQP